MKSRRLFLCLLLLSSPAATAGTLSATVTDQKGKPVRDAVVYAHPVGKTVKTKPTTEIIDQVNKTFIPEVKVITAGSSILFPNKDNIRHHVYSISKPKKFELPLYKGVPANPVKFNKPGEVVLGCNIHDWMRGHIYVVDTPYYALSNASGSARITGLPAGQYTVRLWHPRLRGDPDSTSQTIGITGSKAQSVRYRVKLKRAKKLRRKEKSDYMDF